MNRTINKDMYFDLVERAKKHQLLYHYTSVETLELVLQNQSLKLAHLSNVNDPIENKRITSFWHNRVFVSCFTNTLENAEYFYDNYGDVRITVLNDFSNARVFFDSNLENVMFDFSSDFNSKSQLDRLPPTNKYDWCLYNLTVADVFYSYDLTNHISEDGTELNAGLIKSKQGIDKYGVVQNWSIEKETRLRAAVRPIGRGYYLKQNHVEYYNPINQVVPFDQLFVSLENKILNVEINSTATLEQKEKFRKIKNTYSNRIISID